MGNGNVVANPQELIKFAKRLRSYNHEARNNVDLLNSQFNQLGEFWRDNEYKKFEAEFTQTIKSLNKFFAECEKYELHLLKKAKPLIEYQNKG